MELYGEKHGKGFCDCDSIHKGCGGILHVEFDTTQDCDGDLGWDIAIVECDKCDFKRNEVMTGSYPSELIGY